MRFLIFLLVFLVQVSSFLSQKEYELAKKLKEISGICIYKDSIIFAHNDGGNKPIIYVLNLKGKVLRQCVVSNVKNKDWEDITCDGKGNLFIGDFGNNFSKRKDLSIIKVPIKQVLNRSEVKASVYSFEYKSQSSFPPSKDKLDYDAESLLCDGDNLWFFSKCNDKPYSGVSFVYKIPLKQLASKMTLQPYSTIKTGKRGWLFDSFTAGTYYKGCFYLSTYNRLIKYKLNKKTFELKKTLLYKKFNQKEAISINSKGVLYLANEKNKLLGPASLRVIKKWINEN
ncbi:MAG: hypothetical protein P8I93_00055 [Crocinitomicaceae bacterium]|nr:hypothetical protein [Crocinitomicaceae bacterium]